MKTQIKPTHTQTPWKKLGRDIAIDLSDDKSVTANFAEVATTAVGHWTVAEADANAAFIVKAVNAHEELLDVANGLMDILRSVPRKYISNGQYHFFADATNAIAKAEGL